MSGRQQFPEDHEIWKSISIDQTASDEASSGAMIRLLDFKGSDSYIAETARSTIKGAKTRSEDRALLRRLLRDRHTSPIEFAQVDFEVVADIATARQWFRHRTASYSERSLRYDDAEADFRLPGTLRSQSSTNRQMSGAVLDSSGSEDPRAMMAESFQQSFRFYRGLRQMGVSREQARAVMPVGTMTTFRMSMDTWNLFHFLRLRMALDAQYEIRIYANAIYSILQQLFPLLCEAFEDYILHARTFSRMEVEHIKSVIPLLSGENAHQLWKSISEDGQMSKNEKREFLTFLGLSTDGLV